MPRTFFCFLPVISCTPEFKLVADECGVDEAQLFYVDEDGDGYGLTDDPVIACEAPEGTATEAGDCDDANPSVYPTADETCNEQDDDCNGLIDDSGQGTGFIDADGDGYGDAAVSHEGCDTPAGLVANGDDCDDSSSSVSPGAPERCDDVDWDCDGSPTTQAGEAAACGVLIYEGNTPENKRVGPADLATFSATMLDEGASEVSTVLTLPDTWSGTRVLYLSHASEPFDDATTASIEAFVQGGGTLLMVGENSEWLPGAIPTYNGLLEALGAESRFVEASLDAFCGDWVGTMIDAHPLSQDVDAMSYAFTSELSIGSAASELLRGESEQPLVAVDSGLILVADSTIMFDHCEGSLLPGNIQFFRNLFHQGRP